MKLKEHSSILSHHKEKPKTDDGLVVEEGALATSRGLGDRELVHLDAVISISFPIRIGRIVNGEERITVMLDPRR